MAERRGESAARASSGPPSTINLQFLSPSVHEVPGGRLNLPNVPLDIEVEALQRRIAEHLQTSPSPDRLRLIFYGRAMTDAKAKLRTYLNREFDRPDPPQTITIHLVISPSDSQNAASTTSGMPDPATAHAEAQAESLARIMAIGRQPANLAQHTQHTQHTQIPGGIPGNLGQGMPQPLLSQSANMNLQQHQQALQGQLQAIQQQLGMAMPNFPFLPSLPGMQQHHMANSPNLGGQTHAPSNGPLNTQGLGDNRPSGPHTPHAPHIHTSVQETIDPLGQRMRVTTHVESMVISRSGTPQPTPNNGQNHMPEGGSRTENRSANQGPPTTSPTPSVHPMPSNLLPRIGFTNPSMLPSMPFFQPPPQGRPSSTTTAWLVSSPAGPQAVLFSPEHGFFSSRPQPAPAPTQAQAPNRARILQFAAANQGAVANLQQMGNQMERRAQQAEDPPRRRNELPRQNQNQNQDMVALFFSRIWLFIRLYFFVLMFTETGSWLRYAILTGAVVYCLTPPNTFLQEQFRALQRHLDGLVPLAPTAGGRDARQGGQGQPPNENNQPQGAINTRARREISPQEAAQRLLQQHNNRNQSWWVETGRRIERSVALFLASLVPGVGERHIRARNEAEAAAREEAEREERIRENEARAQTEAQGGGETSSTPAPTATQEGSANNTGGDERHVNAQDNAAPQPPPLIEV